MPINGSEFINNPFTTVFSPFVDLLGTGFYLIPLSFLCIALYIKTKDVVVVSMFMIGSGIFLASGSIFTGYIEMGLVYIIFIAIGFVAMILGIIFPSGH